jgi:hypothetical protein
VEKKRFFLALLPRVLGRTDGSLTKEKEVMVRRVTDPELGYEGGAKVVSRIEMLSDNVAGQEFIVLSHDGPPEFVATFKKFLSSQNKTQLRDFNEVIKNWKKVRLEYLQTTMFAKTKKRRSAAELKAEDPIFQALRDKEFLEELRSVFDTFRKPTFRKPTFRKPKRGGY